MPEFVVFVAAAVVVAVGVEAVAEAVVADAAKELKSRKWEHYLSRKQRRNKI